MGSVSLFFAEAALFIYILQSLVMLKLKVNFILFNAMIFLVSCAVGRKLSFEKNAAGPAYPLTKSATIGFRDQRELVIAGKEKPSFCGHLRSTVQINYNMQTQSGRPLADDFAASVSSYCNGQGSVTNTLSATVSASTEAALKAFQSGDHERLLLFTINAWEAEGMPKWSTVAYKITCDFELKVYDKNGALLASAATKDIKMVEESAPALSLKKLQLLSDAEFNEQIGKLFAAEAVRKQL